jgi:hypothetical protein
MTAAEPLEARIEWTEPGRSLAAARIMGKMA